MASSDMMFRAPNDLAVHRTPLRRVAVIGSCLMETWPDIIAVSEDPCPADFFLANNAFTLPRETPNLHELDFQIIQIPLRSLLPEHAYFNLSFADAASYQRVFDDSRAAMLVFLDSAMRWNRERGVLSFILNILQPQQNPQGRLLSRYDLRNPIYFVEKLNEALTAAVAGYSNAYVFDFDQVVSSFGRRYFQDDHVWQINHASALSDADARLDGERLDGTFLASETFPNRVFDVIRDAWEEMVACYRTIRQIDAVKLVIFDLDDTLWRGVAAERGDVDAEMLEGWPLGLVEALSYLKRRGVLLAIVSKNDRQTIEHLWTDLFQGRLRLEDFAVTKINWLPKSENVEAVLAETNLLARNVLFIDDNPAERAAVAEAFPDIRVVGGNPLLWRRLLLWAPELQVAAITDESASRTEMVRAQVERDHERSAVSREEFLDSLGLQVEVWIITDPADPSFKRAFELVNKTNQFNTTGKRWADEEFRAALEDGLKVVVARAKDRFTNYGLISVLLLRRDTIEQMVLSCRVVGLDIEAVLIEHALRTVASNGFSQAVALQLPTASNLLSRDLFARFGFEERGEGWVHSLAAFPCIPPHINIASNEPQTANVT